MDERRIDVAPAAIAKVIAAIALVWLWLHLWQLVMILLIAIVVAIGLDPIVGWLQRRRLSRRFASLLVVTVVAAIIAGFFWITGSSLSAQARELGGTIATVRHQVSESVPAWARDSIVRSGTVRPIPGWLHTRRRASVTGSTCLPITPPRTTTSVPASTAIDYGSPILRSSLRSPSGRPLVALAAPSSRCRWRRFIRWSSASGWPSI